MKGGEWKWAPAGPASTCFSLPHGLVKALPFPPNLIIRPCFSLASVVEGAKMFYSLLLVILEMERRSSGHEVSRYPQDVVRCPRSISNLRFSSRQLAHRATVTPSCSTLGFGDYPSQTSRYAPLCLSPALSSFLRCRHSRVPVRGRLAFSGGVCRGACRPPRRRVRALSATGRRPGCSTRARARRRR